MSSVVNWLARDTHITYQVLKRVWPAAQRDSLFWSTIRHCPSDDDDGPDYWIVVNYSTDCVPVPQVCHITFQSLSSWLLFWLLYLSGLLWVFESPWFFFQIFKALKVLENRPGPWKSLNLCLKVLESAWMWFYKMPWPNQLILKKVFRMASFWPQMCIKSIFGQGFTPDPTGWAYNTYICL